MTSIRDRAFAALRAASTELAIVDAVNAAHRAFYGNDRHLRPFVPVNVDFLDGTAHAYRAEAYRLDDDSIAAFRLWRLSDIATEAGVATRLLRAGAGIRDTAPKAGAMYPRRGRRS